MEARSRQVRTRSTPIDAYAVRPELRHASGAGSPLGVAVPSNDKPSGLSETMLSEMFLYRFVDEVLVLAAQVETGVFKPVFGRDGDPRRKGDTLFDL
jgi:hypothetical protein